MVCPVGRRRLAVPRGGGTLMVRVPGHDLLRGLLAATGPVASTAPTAMAHPPRAAPPRPSWPWAVRSPGWWTGSQHRDGLDYHRPVVEASAPAAGGADRVGRSPSVHRRHHPRPAGGKPGRDRADRRDARPHRRPPPRHSPRLLRGQAAPPRHRPGGGRPPGRGAAAPGGDPGADPLREPGLAGGPRGARLLAQQQVRGGRAGQALLRRLPGGRPGRGPLPPAGPWSSSVPSTPTCSRTRGRRPTWPSTPRFSSPGTRCWAWPSTRGATSPTAPRSTSAAASTTSSRTSSPRPPAGWRWTRSAAAPRRCGPS